MARMHAQALAALVALRPPAPPQTQHPKPLPIPPRIMPFPPLITLTNQFGLFRRYNIPTQTHFHLPDAELSLDERTDGQTSLPSADNPQAEKDQLIKRIIRPFPNISSFMLSHWFWNAGWRKTASDRWRLVKEVLLSPLFLLDDLRNVNFGALDQELESWTIPGPEEEPLVSSSNDRWITSSVVIQVPTGKVPRNTVHAQKPSLPSSKPYIVPGLQHRKLVEVIKSAFASENAKRFHYEPFEQFWQPPDPSAKPQRIFDELYASKAWNEEHERIQRSLPQEGCSLPRVIAAMMLWSDSTQVSQFGQSSLWPIYYFPGNLSKYERASPRARSGIHIAYIPKLPPEIVRFIREVNPKCNIEQMKTHCRRELMHAVLRHLLDDEFVMAYKHGIIIKCADNVQRRVFPRIFTYSADYIEKVLLASILCIGGCPCPICLVPKSLISNLGTKEDMALRYERPRVADSRLTRLVKLARSLIYNRGSPLKSKVVQALLKELSLTPTMNAFTERLGFLGFDIYRILTVDLLHEFELGVWKALFIHLIRILDSIEKNGLIELDYRLSQTPIFGQNTIRRFPANVSGMKRLAARDFEDILQCSIPAFEGLFPKEYDTIISKLLFTMCAWHALAKLRLHTESTLDALQTVTSLLGQQLRHFHTVVCPAFKTWETSGELEARARREMKKQARTVDKVVPPQPSPNLSHPFTPSNNSAKQPPTTNVMNMPITPQPPLPTSNNHAGDCGPLSLSDQNSATPTAAQFQPFPPQIHKRRRDNGNLVLVLPPRKRPRLDHPMRSPPASITITTNTHIPTTLTNNRTALEAPQRLRGSIKLRATLKQQSDAHTSQSRKVGKNSNVKTSSLDIAPNDTLADTIRSLPPRAERKIKNYSLSTPKFHALGHYPSHIEQFGTTDSISTQRGELEHVVAKSASERARQYMLEKQVTSIVQRQSILHNMMDKVQAILNNGSIGHKIHHKDCEKDENLPYAIDQQKYQIAKDERNYIFLPNWLCEHRDDLAFKDFVRKLKGHILTRLADTTGSANLLDYSAEEQQKLQFRYDGIFAHAAIRSNYTTYDVRRAQDSIKPHSDHSDIMLLANDNQITDASHPFWYGRAIGVFHANVLPFAIPGRVKLEKETRMDFIWVRWFQMEPAKSPSSGFEEQRLDRIRFLDAHNPEAFGFVDPQQVIRGCHLIPAFSSGRTDKFLSTPSIARKEASDWESFYVSRFVDRDMFMRYLGGGVGHVASPHQHPFHYPNPVQEGEGEAHCPNQNDSVTDNLGAEEGVTHRVEEMERRLQEELQDEDESEDGAEDESEDEGEDEGGMYSDIDEDGEDLTGGRDEECEYEL